MLMHLTVDAKFERPRDIEKILPNDLAKQQTRGVLSTAVKKLSLFLGNSSVLQRAKFPLRLPLTLLFQERVMMVFIAPQWP